MKKTIRYRIQVSLTFPATHPRKGENTFFPEMIRSHLVVKGLKIHTIRANYALWAKRFEKINRGEAVLELYYWTGKPYNSKTVTICQLGKDDGIGLQELFFLNNEMFDPIIEGDDIIQTKDLAANDGLSLQDFTAWFKGYDSTKPMAIIHFTSFRY